MNGESYAIKKLSKDFLQRTNKVNTVFRERDILVKNTTCPFLPKIYHTFADDEYLYIVMEYISQGTLSEKIMVVRDSGFTKEQAQFYAAQLVLTLEYLQSVNVAHRDLKPGNIMLDKD